MYKFTYHKYNPSANSFLITSLIPKIFESLHCYYYLLTSIFFTRVLLIFRYNSPTMRTLYLLLLIPFWMSCQKDSTVTPDISYDPPKVNYLMGNPSNAKTDINEPDNYLVEKRQFVLSYNNSRGGANWVSWHLSVDWKGDAPRQNDFRPDPDLPETFFKAGTSSFSGTGFDRGHMCPSEDRDLNVTDNSATFVMSNMLPQAPNCNQDTWVNLENYARKLVTEGYEIYTIAGGYGEGGSGSNGGITTRIAAGKIAVPERVWKILVVVPYGDNDLDRIDETTRVIAVDMPNRDDVTSHSWGYYRVSVHALEQKTGFNFLTNLSSGLQDVLESKVDNGPTM